MVLPKLHVRDIPDAGLDLEVSLDASWLRKAFEDSTVEPATDPAGTLMLRLDLSGDDVIFNVRGKAAVTFQCVRCLEPLAGELYCVTSLLLEPAGSAKHRAHDSEAEVELTAEDLDRDTFENGIIDVGHWVREQLLVEIPPHPKHANCEAPRWSDAEKTRSTSPFAVLEKFKNKE
ncbi:MAG: DUF177 domain-containing protein [Deltaproteobacteria bacterium]|nr:DUF177 domain-containing protein [Deltaproteobacteria bacterium]